MNLKSRLARTLVSRLSQQEIMELAGEALTRWMARLSREEKVAFLTELVEKNLQQALEGLTREDRAQLMNALLRRVAREFPLEDVDILGAFGTMEADDELPEWRR
ncbi:MAG: hypothetical protein J7M16_05835 [Anaerolineae bacterium]|nr:hypothetical protein [Anaerolineae bacterium]